jgi:putative transposase
MRVTCPQLSPRQVFRVGRWPSQGSEVSLRLSLLPLKRSRLSSLRAFSAEIGVARFPRFGAGNGSYVDRTRACLHTVLGSGFTSGEVFDSRLKNWRSALIRLVLSDAQWERIAPELPGKIGDPGRSGDDNRLFVEAVLWVARTGAPWRDLPDEFGKWYTVYTRFWRWAQKGVWERIFKRLSEDSDFEYVLIDATLVRVHQHGTGAKGGLKLRPSANRAAA